MQQAEDGSWVPDSFYAAGNELVQAEDGSWVPASFYGARDLDERVSAVEGRQDDVARHRSAEPPNLRDLKDCLFLAKVQDGQVAIYDVLVGQWVPGAKGLSGRNAIVETALGEDRVDIGVVSGIPEVILEDNTFTLWRIRNVAGLLVFATPAGTKAQLDSSGNLILVGALGSTYLMAADLTGPFVENASSAGVGTVDIVNRTTVTNTPATVTGMNGQTGDLHRWRDYLGNVLARISASGVFTAVRDDTPAIHGVVRSTVTQTFTNNTEATVAYDTTVENVGMTWGSNQWTVITAGVYMVTFTMKWNLLASGVATNMEILTGHIIKNKGTGSDLLLEDDHRETLVVPASMTIVPTVNCVAVARLAVGDTITTTALQKNSAANSYDSSVGNRNSPVMTITRIGA